MPNISNKFTLLFLVLALIHIPGCSEKEHCSKFIHEEYQYEQADPLLEKEALRFKKELHEWFGVASIAGIEHDAYHLLFYSSHGFGKSVKFERIDTSCYLSIKCLAKEEWFDCKDYKIQITSQEWKRLEVMIYDFDFWTAKRFIANNDVLDGFVYFLDATRPEAKACNKRTYHLIGRGSPRYDKVGALCAHIAEYEDQLAFCYGKEK